MSRRSDRHGEALITWEATAQLVAHPVLGARGLRPLEMVLGGAPAGHAEEQEEGGEHVCGSWFERAGQRRGPRAWEQARKRILVHLDRAQAFRAWLDEDPRRTSGQLARSMGFSRARVSQALRLARLPEEVFADLRTRGRSGRVPTEVQLRALAGIEDPQEALASYWALVLDETDGRVPLQSGFVHLLAQARRYQAMLDADGHATQGSIAEAEGVSPQRVGQVLALLQLPPEIVAAIEVPPERLPASLTTKALNRIAAMKDQKVQRLAFSALWPQLLAGTDAAAK